MRSRDRREYRFTFGTADSHAYIQQEIPTLEQIEAAFSPVYGGPPAKVLLVCDTNTEYIARKIRGGRDIPLCILPAGEDAKNWQSAERIIRAALDAGLGRDGLFVGIGGGVVSDLTAFAASVYMRGARLCLVSTTLLGMVDAALGGKTGFDLFGIKNLAGTFYPAGLVFAPLESLTTLPKREWKSGMAELIKTAVLDDSDAMFARLAALKKDAAGSPVIDTGELALLVARSMEVKGRIVEADPKETGSCRALLNLGHSFGHALEAAAGLGRLTHGEAVAWGMVRACELGQALNITPPTRAAEIRDLIQSFDCETRAPHPLLTEGPDVFVRALAGDKKKKAGKSVFVVPAETGAELVTLDSEDPRLKSIINRAAGLETIIP